MKRNLLYLLLITLYAAGAYAARAYRQGEVIVKFNEQSSVKVDKRSAMVGAKGVDAVFAKMGVNNIEQLMPLSNEVQARSLRSVNGGTVNANDMASWRAI